MDTFKMEMWQYGTFLHRHISDENLYSSITLHYYRHVLDQNMNRKLRVKVHTCKNTFWCGARCDTMGTCWGTFGTVTTGQYVKVPSEHMYRTHTGQDLHAPYANLYNFSFVHLQNVSNSDFQPCLIWIWKFGYIFRGVCKRSFNSLVWCFVPYG